MDISPSRRWYLLALLITFLGPIIGTASILKILSAPATIDIPLQQIGSSEISITKKGKYTLWAKPPTKVEHTFEAAYQMGEDIEEATTTPYSFIHKNTKTEAKLEQTPPFPLVNWFKIQSSAVRIPIANVTFPKKGMYSANMGSLELPLTLSLGYPSISQIYRSIVLNLILVFSTIIIGPLLAIGILIARNSSRGDFISIEDEEESRTTSNFLAAFCHASAYTCFLYPLGHIISPLFIWLFFKDEYPAVDHHGKAVLNFQISVTLYYILLSFLIFFVIGIPLIILLFLFHMFSILIGIIVAARGKNFRYPLSLYLLK